MNPEKSDTVAVVKKSGYKLFSKKLLRQCLDRCKWHTGRNPSTSASTAVEIWIRIWKHESYCKVRSTTKEEIRFWKQNQNTNFGYVSITLKVSSALSYSYLLVPVNPLRYDYSRYHSRPTQRHSFPRSVSSGLLKHNLYFFLLPRTVRLVAMAVRIIK